MSLRRPLREEPSGAQHQIQYLGLRREHTSQMDLVCGAAQARAERPTRQTAVICSMATLLAVTFPQSPPYLPLAVPIHCRQGLTLQPSRRQARPGAVRSLQLRLPGNPTSSLRRAILRQLCLQ